MQTELYYARQPFQYGPSPASDYLDLDQVFELRGEPHDERLVRLGFVAKVNRGIAMPQCGHCHRKFTTDNALTSHGRLRHDPNRVQRVHDGDQTKSIDEIAAQTRRGAAMPVPQAVEIDPVAREIEQQVERERPLYRDKTQATLKANAAPVPEITTKKAPKKGRRGRRKPAAS